MLVKKINEDFKTAMKSKDKVKVSTLSLLRSELNYSAINSKQKTEDLKDSDVVAVIRRSVKQHNDSIEQFKKGNRAELMEKEAKELEILKTYLPKEMSEEELEKIIEEVIAAAGASSIKDMGRVMKDLVSKVAGRADNSLVSKLVKEKLQG